MSLDGQPLTLAQTRALLERLGASPRKALGQNFLIEGNIVRKSLEMAGLTPGEKVVEIGPGLGTLTRALLGAGVEVYAVERDRLFAQYIREELIPAADGRLHLLEGDAVESPLAELPEGEARFRIVANLPYAISSPWMEGVLTAPHLPERMVLMLQKEAASRLVAGPGSGDYGPIGIFLQAAFARAGQHGVSARCFYPAPAVDSVLLALERLPEPRRFSETGRRLIRKLFTRRRKQIASLCRSEEEPSLRGVLMAWLESLRSEGFSGEERPEVLPARAWEQLDGLCSNLQAGPQD